MAAASFSSGESFFSSSATSTSTVSGVGSSRYSASASTSAFRQISTDSTTTARAAGIAEEAERVGRRDRVGAGRGVRREMLDRVGAESIAEPPERDARASAGRCPSGGRPGGATRATSRRRIVSGSCAPRSCARRTRRRRVRRGRCGRGQPGDGRERRQRCRARVPVVVVRADRDHGYTRAHGLRARPASPGSSEPWCATLRISTGGRCR